MRGDWLGIFLFLSILVFTSTTTPTYSCTRAKVAAFVTPSISAERYAPYHQELGVYHFVSGTRDTGFRPHRSQTILEISDAGPSLPGAKMMKVRYADETGTREPFEIEALMINTGGIMQTSYDRITMTSGQGAVLTHIVESNFKLPSSNRDVFTISNRWERQDGSGLKGSEEIVAHWEAVPRFQLPNDIIYTNCYKLHRHGRDGRIIGYSVFAPGRGEIYTYNAENGSITYLDRIGVQ